MASAEGKDCAHSCADHGCTLNEDGETYTCLHAEHDEVCGYAAPIEGQPCGHTGHLDCGYAPATEGSPCIHTHAVKVDSTDSCYILLCSHKDGGHDDACGYAQAVEAHECHYECAECAAALTADETTTPSTEATTEPSTEPAPVCDCGTDDAAIHATTCAVYVAPENPQCKCAMKCTELNEWCDVCGFDYSKCGGTDTAAVYADDWFTVSGSTLTIDGTLGGKTDATEDDITALVDAIKGYVDNDGITTIIVTGSEPAMIDMGTFTNTAIGEAIYRLSGNGTYSSDDQYNGKIDLILEDVTEIVDEEFYRAHALNSITLPKVTTVGDGAFVDCFYLGKMTFGSVVTSINQSNTVVFYRVAEKVDGCDLVLNCGQLQAEETYKPDLENNVWFKPSWGGNVTWKSITLTHTEDTAATCTDQATCSVCGDSYGEVDADAHSYGDWVSNGDSTHTRACAYDNTHTENGDCSGGTATCTAQAVCETCGTAYGDMGGHSFDTTGLCVCNAQAQVKIGTTFYATLAEAATKVTADSNTIEVLTNVTIGEDETATFTVPAGSTLTVNSGVTLDLSGLTVADITFSGTIINNGTIKLPEGFGIENAPKGGTVMIGENSYTYNSEAGKWICGDNSHIYSANGTCSACGAECAHTDSDKDGTCDICGITGLVASRRDGAVGHTYYYTTLEAAFAANSGERDYIGIYKDYTLNQSLTLPEYTTLRLDMGAALAFGAGVTITSSGTIYLPEDTAYANIPKAITGGTVIIGIASYTWDSENSKWVCTDGSHTPDADSYEDKGDGNHSYTCSVCGLTVTEAHTPDADGYADKSESTHSYTCGLCGAAVTEAHTFADGVCTVCGIIGGYCGGEGDGTNLVWTLVDYALTISGTGAMGDTSGVGDHRGYISSVTIGAGVTTISNDAFNANNGWTAL